MEKKQCNKCEDLADYKCNNCDTYYCEYCAGKEGFWCDCEEPKEPQNIFKIKNKENSTKSRKGDKK